jgi:2-keto-3-deoxy-L-rhamnonate aldolase RhmA
MQANPLRAALERGELQIGTWVNLVRNPAILTLLKAAGLDFARVDMEHTAASMESIANMAGPIVSASIPSIAAIASRSLNAAAVSNITVTNTCRLANARRSAAVPVMS